MQKYSSVITIERFLVQNFANYRTMAEISTAKNSLPKSPTELEKDVFFNFVQSRSQRPRSFWSATGIGTIFPAHDKRDPWGRGW